IPAAAKTPAEAKPSAPAAPLQTTPPSPSSQPSAPRIPAPKPQVPAQIPPSAARVSAPPPLSAYRVPASRPTLQQRMKTVSAIEEALGTNWLKPVALPRRPDARRGRPEARDLEIMGIARAGEGFAGAEGGARTQIRCRLLLINEPAPGSLVVVLPVI